MIFIIFQMQSCFILAIDQRNQESFLDLSYISSDAILAYQDNIQGKRQPRWYLINVLPNEFCSECSIPGSINIPTHKLEKKLANSKKWPRDRKIVVYCAGGDCPLSKYAYEILKKLGFVDVQILAGGIIEWVADKLLVHGHCAFSYLKASV
jgi:rhodanese-related sulfurtransferase